MGHNVDTQLFFYEMHNTKGTHTFDTHIQSTLDDTLCDRPSRETKQTDLQKPHVQKKLQIGWDPGVASLKQGSGHQEERKHSTDRLWTYDRLVPQGQRIYLLLF